MKQKLKEILKDKEKVCGNKWGLSQEDCHKLYKGVINTRKHCKKEFDWMYFSVIILMILSIILAMNTTYLLFIK